MKCKKVRKKLVAYIDEELKEKQRLLVERHLLECTECRKEADLLNKTFYFLKNQQPLEPSKNFEANLWKRIYSVEKKEAAPHPLKRATYIILPAAVAAALIIGVFMGSLVGKIVSSQNVNLEEEYLTSIGLDSFQDLPPGSLPDVYFSLVTANKVENK